MLQLAHRSAVLLLLFVVVASTSMSAYAQDEPPKYEFRGAWIATVLNLDWPVRTVPPNIQQLQLTDMLDKLQAAGINVVFFQVRSETDAMYDSPYEPWSFWLTGEQGRAPQPFYDPLAFVIEEAHKRGMELHAWFNPYRSVRQVGNYTIDPSHVSQQHPDWTLTLDDLIILNPGIQEVRDYITTVISDVVRRYNIDGVHFDDYFYPYPPDQISFQDQFEYNDDPRGFTNIGDWRRDNVNLFVQQVADSINAIKPWLKYGISPFGIWKNGVPNGIIGLDAYNVVYADAVAWYENESIDYLTPQLYWRLGGNQDYARLANWWEQQRNGRHLYPGHGVYRSDRSTFSGTLFSDREIPNQVRFNRGNDGIDGSVFFRAKNITSFPSKGFADSLSTDLYRYPALTPPMAWKDPFAPDAPTNLVAAEAGTDEVVLAWTPPASSDFTPAARRYAIYRVRASVEPDFNTAMDDARNLLAITGETTYTDRPGIATDLYYYVVTSVSANSIESAPSNVVSLSGRATNVETATQPTGFRLFANYPNPFNPTTTIGFALDRPGAARVQVINVLGQVVATLFDQSFAASGTHEVRWDGRFANGQAAPSGTYFYTLEFDGQRETRTMVLAK